MKLVTDFTIELENRNLVTVYPSLVMSPRKKSEYTTGNSLLG